MFCPLIHVLSAFRNHAAVCVRSGLQLNNLRRISCNISLWKDSVSSEVVPEAGGRPRVIGGVRGGTNLSGLESTASVSKRVVHLKSCLKEVFGITEEETEWAVQTHPLICRKFDEVSITALKEAGLTKASLLKNPWLITVPPVEMKVKLDIISGTFPDLGDINKAASLIKYDRNKLLKLLTKWRNEAGNSTQQSKFHFLADALSVPISTLFEQLSSKKFLEMIPFTRVQENTNIILGAGVLKGELANDLWVLRQVPDTYKDRLQTLVDAKVPIKPWLIRSTTTTLQRNIQLYWAEKEALCDHPDKQSYLAQRLSCSPQVVSSMYKRMPSLRRVHAHKLKETIDLLLGSGMSTTMIISTPRILCHKPEKISKRLAELKSLGYKFNSLSVLCKTEANYKRYLASIASDPKLVTTIKLD